MTRSDDNLAVLEELAGMGVRLAIDDFGTGYSSLAYLQRFPVNVVKIDRSFISGIGDDVNDTAIITAIIAMAQGLRLKVVAEGVETPAQLDMLKSLGCDQYQGYFYSAAVPAGDFAKLARDASVGHKGSGPVDPNLTQSKLSVLRVRER